MEIEKLKRMLVEQKAVALLFVGCMHGIGGKEATEIIRDSAGARNITDPQCAGNVFKDRSVVMEVVGRRDMQGAVVSAARDGALKAISEVEGNGSRPGYGIVAIEEELADPMRLSAKAAFAPCRKCSCDYELSREYMYIDYVNNTPPRMCPRARFIYAELLEKYLVNMISGIGFSDVGDYDKPSETYRLVVNDAIINEVRKDLERLVLAESSREI